MEITAAQIIAIMPKAKYAYDNTGISRADKMLPYINAALKEFGIITRKRVCHFLAQIALESAELSRMEENLNYSIDGLVSTFPTRFNAITAKLYARNPRMIGSKIYANRYGNGSEATGDGYRYRGRGLIQITFKDNYARYAKYCGYDVVSKPDLLAQPKGAARSAGWYWKMHGCNELADADNLQAIREAINGKPARGMKEAQLYYQRARLAIKI